MLLLDQTGCISVDSLSFFVERVPVFALVMAFSSCQGLVGSKLVMWPSSGQ